MKIYKKKKIENFLAVKKNVRVLYTIQAFSNYA